MRGGPAPGRDTGSVLGTDFARTLRAAQAGEEDAFARLWRDANPAMIRYLRVVGQDDPYDEACEGWITVVRGLPGFAGDELAWRVWLLACARQRAEESALRRAWGAVTVLPGFHVEGDGEIDIDELLEGDEAVDPTHRGINDTLTALRALPLGQGEVVVLHLGAGLPTSAVADVVGVDEVNIERAETRALERLGTDVDLLTWSLTAPPTPAELADEPVALSAFRKVLTRGKRSDRPKVIAIGMGSNLGFGRVAAGQSASDSSGERRRRSNSPGERRQRSDSIRGGQAGRRGDLAVLRGATTGVAAAGRSRTAILTVAALSVSAISLGGLGAAAYVGVLPDPVQQAMHDAVGAPAPKARGNGTSQSPGSNSVSQPTAGVGPHAAGSPAAGLCRAWAEDKAKGTARDRSVAFRSLSGTAGGADKVEAYCAGVLVPKPTKGSASPTTGAPPSTNTPRATKSPTTKVPSTHAPTTKTSNPNSPTKGAQADTTGKSAKTSTSTTAPSDPDTTIDSHSPNPKSTSRGAKTTSAP
jgi:DNA-directed RNA polymerase specialized sigma24 family protein